MGDVGMLGGAVDHDVEIIAAIGDDEIVENAAIVGQQQRIALLARLERGEGTG
jgi:hypothetical protein